MGTTDGKVGELTAATLDGTVTVTWKKVRKMSKSHSVDSTEIPIYLFVVSDFLFPCFMKIPKESVHCFASLFLLSQRKKIKRSLW